VIGSKKKLGDSLDYSERLSLVCEDDNVNKSQQARLLSLSRSSLYYEPQISDEQLHIMHKIDEIYTEHPYYWSRRMSFALKLEWYNVGRKYTRSLMAFMGLIAWYPKPNTSQANKQHKVYPYLLRNYKITKANEVRSIDITYIRMPKWWMYLVAIIDRYSRKILSWRLSPTLEWGFCIDCLKEALNQYGNPTIFNSDQGIQFTSNEFTGILFDKGIQISMDGRWRAIDNIYIERFWRSLKQEEVYRSEYQTPMDVQLSLKVYINKYNSSRLHQSLGYTTPNQYYQQSINTIQFCNKIIS